MAILIWSDREDALLRSQWGKAEAAVIGAQIGVSKRAVIGRARRLGLEKQRTGTRRVSPYDKLADMQRALGRQQPSLPKLKFMGEL